MVSDDQILARLLYKLLNNKCFAKGHMLEERVVSSVPKHERGRAKKILKQAVRDFLILIYSRTNQGLAYQLNIDKLDDIIEFIKKHHKNPDSMKI